MNVALIDSAGTHTFVDGVGVTYFVDTVGNYLGNPPGGASRDKIIGLATSEW